MDTTAGTIDRQINTHQQQQQQQQEAQHTGAPISMSATTAQAAGEGLLNADAHAGDGSLIVHHASSANVNVNGERTQHHLTTRSGSATATAAGGGAGQVKFGIGNEDTSMLELFPVLGVSQGGRLKIDWETEKEAGLTIRPEESLFDLVHKSSRFTELVMGGKSIAAALGVLHSGTRLLDSENAARRSMSPLESKMYEAWKNGATLPSLASLGPSASSSTTATHRDRLSQRLAPDQTQRASALSQLYKLTGPSSVTSEQLQAFERQYPQLLPLVSARCKVLSVDDDAGLLRSDRVNAECLALRKTINMMDGALNDIVAMIANAVQTVNETSELLRARLEGLTLGTAPCETSHAYNTQPWIDASDLHLSTASVEDQRDANNSADNGVLHVNNDPNDDHMADDEHHLDEHHTLDTAHERGGESIIDDDDAMSEDGAQNADQDAAEDHARSFSPAAQNGSSDCNEGDNDETREMHGTSRCGETQGHPASEASDTERVERLLSDPPEASVQVRDFAANVQADLNVISAATQGDEEAQREPLIEIPRRPETNSVTGFMSLGKKPTFALLPQMAHEEASSPPRGPDGELDATEKAQSGAAGGGSGGEGGGGSGGKSLPFAPAGSSGRGSTPFVIAGRKE